MNNLELSDAGQYTCSATNDAGRGAATVTLEVTGKFSEILLVIRVKDYVGLCASSPSLQ